MGRFFRHLTAVLLLLPLGLGCGYGLKNSKNTLREQTGIRKIYILPVKNDTYKAGVENSVYNALVRTLSRGRAVTLVGSEAEADAVLVGIVSTATSAVAEKAAVESLPGGDTVPQVYKGILVPKLYAAYLGCQFQLKRKSDSPAAIWGSSFSRAKIFPSANQVGLPGTTSFLINESEFDRALGDLAEGMMNDVHEAMLGQF